MRQRHLIKTGWSFRRADYPPSFAHLVSRFPTNIHLDLLAAGRIPDPFVGTNEVDAKVRAVGSATWVYRTTFPTPPGLADSNTAILVFEGLDTIATVELNGETILKANNMFVEYRVPVTERLRPAAQDGYAMVTTEEDGRMLDENELVITFLSAQKHGESEMAMNPAHKWLCSNGDPARLAVRKAQYHWGWDWGPTLMTCGPWKPVALEVYQARIADVYAEAFFDSAKLNSPEAFAGLDKLSLVVRCAFQGPVAQIKLELTGPDGRCTKTAVKSGGAQTLHTIVDVSKPKLWYPARYGPQSLYTLTVTIFSHDGKPLDKLSRRIGLRHLRLVQERCRHDSNGGTSFFFEVNGIPIFCGGSNWIPADSFLARLTPDKYRDWVRLAVRGNQTMLRVWGGGIYEDDRFYDACDEAGILVWQDFMFACGNYPASEAFRNLVEKEVRQNVTRLRRHPCIALFAGNNEDYQMAEEHQLGYDARDTDPQNWLESGFPARYLYEKLIRDVCAQLAPNTPYHPGSPWGGAKSSDPTVGDIHQWNVWHGSQRRYQDYGQLSGRFVSEFGMQALPCVATTESYLGGDASQRGPSSAVVDFHNKATGQERRLGMYLVENIGYPGKTLEDVTYATQLLQAEAMASAIRAWRANWIAPGARNCGGALVWQLNDCWPCTSWAICDYYLRPKPAYFAIKRELADITVRVARSATGDSAAADDDILYTVSASNISMRERRVFLTLRVCESDTGVLLLPSVGAARRKPLAGHDCTLHTLPPNSSAVLASGFVLSSANAGRHIIWAQLAEFTPTTATTTTTTTTISSSSCSSSSDAAATKVAEHVLWPDPLKHIPFGTPEIEGPILDVARQTLRLRARRPAKGVFIEADGDNVEFEDNFVDVLPEWTTVRVRGATERTRFRMTYFGGGGDGSGAGIQKIGGRD